MNFQPHINTDYPPGNTLIFEEWFAQNLPETERKFLPVFFTSFFVNNGYGKSYNANVRLREFIESLDRTKKWYTVLQYDDGPVVDLSKLDIIVFGSGGGRIDAPIPLICQPHQDVPRGTRTVFASFVGNMTHKVRQQLMHFRTRAGFEIHRKTMPIKPYCEMMARSVFALCPRGYGATSFRICEALQFGAIPVYISDQFIVPVGLNFEDYGVIVHINDVPRLEQILRSITPEEIAKKRQFGKLIYENFYTYEGCRSLIEAVLTGKQRV